MNTTDNNDKDAQKAREAELEKRMEKKCEAWGNSIDQKVDSFEKRIPRPVNALLDAVCISVLIAGAAWGCKKLSLINNMPSYSTFGIIFCALFVISLIYRLLIKPKQ